MTAERKASLPPDKNWFELYSHLLCDGECLCVHQPSFCDTGSSQADHIRNYPNTHLSILKQLLSQETDVKIIDILQKEIAIASLTTAIDQWCREFSILFGFDPSCIVSSELKAQKEQAKELEKAVADLEKLANEHKKTAQKLFAKYEEHTIAIAELNQQKLAFDQRSELVDDEAPELDEPTKTSFSPLAITGKATFWQKKSEIIDQEYAALEKAIQHHHRRAKAIEHALNQESYKRGAKKLAEWSAQSKALQKLKTAISMAENAHLSSQKTTAPSTLKKHSKMQQKCMIQGYLESMKFRINDDALYKKLYLKFLNIVLENANKQAPAKEEKQTAAPGSTTTTKTLETQAAITYGINLYKVAQTNLSKTPPNLKVAWHYIGQSLKQLKLHEPQSINLAAAYHLAGAILCKKGQQARDLLEDIGKALEYFQQAKTHFIKAIEIYNHLSLSDTHSTELLRHLKNCEEDISKCQKLLGTETGKIEWKGSFKA